MNNQGFRRSISLFILLYYLILFAERAQSIIRVIAAGVFFADAFAVYVNILTVLSLCTTVVLLCSVDRGFWKTLVDRDTPIDPARTALVCGTILLSGMVHTEYTLPILQFVSYGALIIALVLATVNTARTTGRKCRLWYSLVYLVVFSMAIPVVYRSQIEAATIFHFLEASTAIVLVGFFTVKMKLVFSGKGENLLLPLPFIVMAVCDAAIILMRVKEELNTFVMIFAISSAVLFLVGIVAYRKKK